MTPAIKIHNMGLKALPHQLRGFAQQRLSRDPSCQTSRTSAKAYALTVAYEWSATRGPPGQPRQRSTPS